MFTSAHAVMDKIVEHVEKSHKVVITTEEHAQDLIRNMREIDKLEVSCFGYSPSKAVERSIQESDFCFTILSKDEKVMGIFGAGVSKEEPLMWLLGTKELDRNPMTLLRHCQKWIYAIAEAYGSVSNWIHADNLVCLRWLQWCGAELSEPVEVQGELLRKFKINVEKQNV